MCNLGPKDGNIVTRDDLFQEACLAAYRALEMFDGSKGNKFITYMTTCIDNALNDYCRKNCRSVKVSQKVNSKICDINKCLKAKMSYEEIADELGIDEYEIHELLMLNVGSVSVDREISDDSDEHFDRFISVEPEEPNVEIEILNDVLNSQEPSEEKDIFCYFHGVSGKDQLKMSDIRKKYPQYSESTIRRRIKSYEAMILPKIEREIRNFRNA